MVNNLPIAQTKIIVPRRRDDLLTRQRLLEQLDDLLDYKLIIVAAPAGYGKTSLLIDFANHTHWPISWLSLDQLDQDLFRFVTHLMASIQARFPAFGHNMSAILNNTPQDQINLPGLVTTLVNDIYENISEHFIIILDDYQLIEESQPVNDFINRFLQDVDENCHLIVSSRRLLSLVDLPLWVARNLVGGISFEEIAFTSEEIQALFLQNYHLSLSNKSALEISKKSEGWITGLLLSSQLFEDGIDERMRISRVSGVDLYDYMAQQIFDSLPDEIKAFLLRSSLLEEFNAQHCKRILGKALELQLNWQDLMNQVMKRNLFLLPVGEGPDFWLRFHHLFRDFLQTRMRDERPKETRKITIALGDFYTEQKDWKQAFVLYRSVNAIDRMVGLIEMAGPEMVTKGQLMSLKKWISELPPAITTSHPSILSLRAAILIGTSEVKQGVIVLDEVINSMGKDTSLIETLSLSLVRRAFAHQTLGNFECSENDSQRAIELVEGRPELGLIRAEAMRILGGTFFLQGNVNQALVVLKQSLRLFETFDDEQNIPKLLFNIGFVNVALGNYHHAEKLYLDALDYWQSGGNYIWAAELLNNLGVLQQQRGAFESAAENFEKAIHYARINNSPHTEAVSLSSLGDLYRDLDAFQEAVDIYKKARNISKQIQYSFLLFYLDLAEGVLDRRENDLANAKLMFESARSKVTDSSSGYNKNLLSSEWSMLELSKGNLESAFDYSIKAYDFFHSGGNETESLRAALTCALATAGMGKIQKALGCFEEIMGALIKNDYSVNLVIQAREFKDFITQKKSKKLLKPVIGQLLEKIEEFEEKLAIIRRKIRHQASVIPFAPPKMIIQSFGKAEVYLNNTLISSSEWQTQTARNMFYLILANPAGLTKEQIGIVFWPDSTADELKLRFKNSLYRLRRAVGRDTVVLENDYYKFNWSLDYDYDVEKFISSFEQAQLSDDFDEKMNLLRKVVHQYTGEYLSEIDETWVVLERQRYYLMYLDALLLLANGCMEKKEYKSALHYCFQALSEDACLEDAHRLAMRIHAATGNRAEVVRQYEHCCAALTKEINIPPSQKTRELYQALIQN